jgi:hypothetical protein
MPISAEAQPVSVGCLKCTVDMILSKTRLFCKATAGVRVSWVVLELASLDPDVPLQAVANMLIRRHIVAKKLFRNIRFLLADLGAL